MGQLLIQESAGGEISLFAVLKPGEHGCKFVGLEKVNVKQASLQPGTLERPAPRSTTTHKNTVCEGTKRTDVKAYFRAMISPLSCSHTVTIQPEKTKEIFFGGFFFLGCGY